MLVFSLTFFTEMKFTARFVSSCLRIQARAVMPEDGSYYHFVLVVLHRRKRYCLGIFISVIDYFCHSYFYFKLCE